VLHNAVLHKADLSIPCALRMLLCMSTGFVLTELCNQGSIGADCDEQAHWMAHTGCIGSTLTSFHRQGMQGCRAGQKNDVCIPFAVSA
jgi:hypothetical protein